MTDTPSLTPTELDWLTRFLEEAAENFIQHGCNDFNLPASDDNKAIAIAVQRHLGVSDEGDDYHESAAWLQSKEDELPLTDFELMGYFARRCKQLATGQEVPALSPAEYRVIALLLQAVIDTYPYEGEEEGFWTEYVYPATPENKTLFAAVFEFEGRPDAAQAAREAEEEVDISDFPIHRYLADRCKRLAGRSA
jgi:hypothetical protein